MKTTIERFTEKYIPVPEAGCWLWERAVLPAGYGLFGMRGRKGRRMFLAHRVSWELHNGPIPEGLVVCHKCDVPSCVNPDHLFIGTASDNQKDCFRKGRSQALRVLKEEAERKRSLTHCRHGHEYTLDNVYVGRTGGRKCRACVLKSSAEQKARGYGKEYYEKNRARMLKYMKEYYRRRKAGNL